MIDPMVRLAAPCDVDELRTLESMARASLIDARGGARWLDEHPLVGDRWELLVDGESAGRQICFVAVLDDLVVGYLILVLDDDDTARVDQVFVRPDARQCGFGDALMEAAMDTGREHHSLRIEGQALPGDRETKNLYERAGITARLITVSSKLN